MRSGRERKNSQLMKLKFSLLIILLIFIGFLPVSASAQTGPAVTQAINQAGSGFSFYSFIRGMLGLVVLIGICYIFSTNRKAISWKVVIFGLLFQFILALAVLKVPAVQQIIE